MGQSESTSVPSMSNSTASAAAITATGLVIDDSFERALFAVGAGQWGGPGRSWLPDPVVVDADQLDDLVDVPSTTIA